MGINKVIIISVLVFLSVSLFTVFSCFTPCQPVLFITMLPFALSAFPDYCNDLMGHISMYFNSPAASITATENDCLNNCIRVALPIVFL